MSKIRIGDRAPAFALPDAAGRLVRLDDFRGRPVVVYFYPRDETPGCTAEACAFRDAYEEFRDAGAAVIGVSGDDAASHRAFAERRGLPFVLLSDAGGTVRTSYGANGFRGLIPGRITYVIDGEGFVRNVFASRFRPRKHVAEALAAIRSMSRTA